MKSFCKRLRIAIHLIACFVDVLVRGNTMSGGLKVLLFYFVSFDVLFYVYFAMMK